MSFLDDASKWAEERQASSDPGTLSSGTELVQHSSETETRYSITKSQLAVLVVFEITLTSLMVYGAFKAGAALNRGKR